MFSADGQHVAFTDGRLDFATNVRIIDLGATANNQHMINAGKQEAQMCAMNDSCPDDTNPVWSPSSSQMAFVEKRDKKLNICLAGVDGGKQKCLTEGTGGGWSPAWSPDGRQIIFLSDRGGTVEIYRMDADGNNLEMIKTGLTIPACPTWSPDETKIAFTAGENGHSQVYVANADGTQPIKLTNDPIIGFTCPQWQP
jgi:TolB protein